jgi:hypothetical protein
MGQHQKFVWASFIFFEKRMEWTNWQQEFNICGKVGSQMVCFKGGLFSFFLFGGKMDPTCHI